MTNEPSQLPQRSDEANHRIDEEKLQEGVRLLLEGIGEDPDREDLVETWKRRVPESLITLTNGERNSSKPTMRTFNSHSDDLIVKTGIPVYSLCEHHLLPFFGTANIAYRPTGQVIGLSKLTRYVRWRSRRLTMQEQLTSDIASGLADEIDAEMMVVELNATHLCEAMRGIETKSMTNTRTVVGDPTDIELKQFQSAINREHQGF